MKLLERVESVGMRRRLAPSTIQCYQLWIGDYLRFSRVEGRWRDPAELAAAAAPAAFVRLAAATNEPEGTQPEKRQSARFRHACRPLERHVI